MSFGPSIVQVDGVELGNCLGSTGHAAIALGTEIDNGKGEPFFRSDAIRCREARSKEPLVLFVQVATVLAKRAKSDILFEPRDV